MDVRDEVDNTIHSEAHSVFQEFVNKYEKPVPAFKAPAEAWKSAVALGMKKARLSVPMTLLLAIQAGVQLGIGSATTVAIASGLSGMVDKEPAGVKILSGMFGLPIGLTMTVVMGSELFTGSTAILTAAYLDGQCTLAELLKNWVVSYVGNLLGSGLLAYMCYAGGSMHSTFAAFVKVANIKAHLTFGQAFIRGILCNWLVTTAVWLGQASSDLLSKVFMICVLITIFVILAFEHSVANMFGGSFAALVGGPNYWYFLVHNLIPVTMGNIIGGSIFTAGMNYIAWGSAASYTKALVRRTLQKNATLKGVNANVRGVNGTTGGTNGASASTANDNGRLPV